MYNNNNAFSKQMKSSLKMERKSSKQELTQHKTVAKKTTQSYESGTYIGDSAKIKPKVLKDACMRNCKSIASSDSVNSYKSSEKTATALLSELTRLRTQQKYLECSQVKLNAAAFEDPPEFNGLPNNKFNPIRHAIEEIEQLKHTLAENLHTYRECNLQDVYHVGIFLDTIQDDIRNPRRIKNMSVKILRDRLIGINLQLMQLAKKNAMEFAELKFISKQLEADANKLMS